MIAHLLLGALHSEPVLEQVTADGPARLAAAIRGIAVAVLDSPWAGSVEKNPASGAAGPADRPLAT